VQSSNTLQRRGGVSAIALKVDDAAAAFARADELLLEPFRGVTRADGVSMPAVHGLGGTVLYFVDGRSGVRRHWEMDFNTLRNREEFGLGLNNIDHISQSMELEEMPTCLLFYMSLLDVKKKPVEMVTDPGGIVLSQVVENAAATLRFILNASQSRQTLSARFVSKTTGPSVEHIAFITDDIFATAEQFRTHGLVLLSIPDNYYDDLGVRADLPQDMLERLRANNVLYERCDAGEYFQFYTRTFEAGFFFEVVERRDYGGFGAINAPIRLAAQTRLSREDAIKA